MKKIVFFSLEDGWLGGVARVNEALQPALRQEGFSVLNLFLRGCDFPLPESKFNTVLREKAPWNFVSGSQIISALKAKGLFTALRLFGKRLKVQREYREDLKKARAYLLKEKPDYIVVTHYLLLDAIPKEFLSRTLYHVHTSFDATFSHKANRKALVRYNGKINFLWLSQKLCERAQKEGFAPSFYVYNPLSDYPEDVSNAAESKTVAVLSRFSEEKRLPLAVSLLKRAMDSLSDPNEFRVEFWGMGPEEEALRGAIGSDPRFRLMGHTDSPFSVWSGCRFGINTSRFEGFSISILESAACGIPTVSFDFGDAATEEILDGTTGFVIPKGDEEGFVKTLISLFEDPALVAFLSKGAREHAENFKLSRIAESWKELLESLSLDK